MGVNDDIRRSTFGVQRSTFNVQRSTFGVQRSTFTVQRSPFTAGLSETSRFVSFQWSDQAGLHSAGER